MPLPDESWPAWPLLLLLAPGAPAGAQTIADYSRAQSAWIEAGMEQAAVRAAALSAPVAASAGTSASAPANAAPRRAPEIAPVEPVVHVSGVFASATRTVAEIVVDGTAYVVASGQLVPGTPWRVDAISADRVVLGRSAPAGRGGVEREDLHRIVVLPPTPTRGADLH